MSKSKFVYVTYIAAKPEQIWQALLDAQFTRQYWGHDNVSDWKPGSTWEHRANDEARSLRLVGEVVESAPPRRLVLTWAFPEDAANKANHSRVTFELEPIEEMTRLTVTHDELEADSKMLRGISEGWPRVLSSLKSLLETGRPLRTWAGKGT
jgi:uncharacterized protein YndB with AHSA1/START domain